MRFARTYPGVFSLVAVVGGIALAYASGVPATGWLVVAGAALAVGIGAVLLRRDGAAGVLFALVLAGFSAFGFAREAYDFGAVHVSRLAGEAARFHVFGTIEDWPAIRSDRIDLRLRVDSLGVAEQMPSGGAILLKVADTSTFVQYGDRIEFFARLYPVGGASDYRRNLRLQGIHALAYVQSRQDIRRVPRPAVGMVPVVDTLRGMLTAALERTLDEDGAALAGGFLIGETRDIPNDVYRGFRDSGTLHLLAVSGSNVALVVGFVLVLLRPFRAGRGVRTVLLLLALGLFVLLCRGEPSVVRAAVMASLVLLARLVGRRIDLNNIVALAAAGILMADPAQLFEVGFQLSFVTAWGLVYITPKLYHALDRKSFGRVRRWAILAVAGSLTAQVFSAPLVALYFHQVPVLSTVANLVIVPLVSIAVVGGMVLVVLDFLLPPLAVAAGAVVDRLMDLIISSLTVFSGPEAPMMRFDEVPWVGVVVVYGLLVMVVPAAVSVRWRRVVLISAVVAANLGLGWMLVRAADRPDMTVDLVRVPGGVAALATADRGSGVDLVITGLTARDYPLDERVLGPWLERRAVEKVDRIILLGADYDAVAAVFRLGHLYSVDTVLVHRTLAATAADLVGQGKVAAGAGWRAFGDTAQTEGEGLWAGEHGVVLRLGSAAVLFGRRAGDLEYLIPGRGGDRQACWGVVGERVEWPDDLAGMSDLGGVVCAEIEQLSSQRQTGAEVGPGRKIDLRQSGGVVLELRRGAGQEPVRILNPD